MKSARVRWMTAAALGLCAAAGGASAGQGNWESLVWSFGGTGDGATPVGPLMQAADGSIYGLTSAGGANGGGTIFQIN